MLDGTAGGDPFAPIEEKPPAANAAPGPETWEPRMPAPEPVPERSALSFPGLSHPERLWVYRDAEGRPLFFTARFEPKNLDGSPVTGKDGKPKKHIVPYTYGRRVWTTQAGRRLDRTGWHPKAPPEPRPLYGLDRLAARPGVPVLLTEGEKAADAAGTLFAGHVAVAWQGGSNAPGMSDWSPLASRDVTIWPDNDAAGRAAAAEAAKRLRATGAASVRVVRVPAAWPDGWDLADPPPEGVTTDRLAAMLAETGEPDPAEDDAPGAEPFGATLPEGFRMTGKGLMFFPPATAKNADPQPDWVCAPFRVLGEANNGHGGAWGLPLAWRDRDGREHVWSVPKRLVHANGNEIAAELEHNGLTCGVDGRAHQLLKLAIASVRSDRRMLAVERGGWHVVGGAPAFMLPNGRAFGPHADAAIMQGDTAAGREGADFRAAGTLVDWQARIGAACVGNSRLVLGVCAALDGPLLDILNEQSGGVHVDGQSQSGKSTVAFVAGSVWGRGERGRQVRMWRATANGLEGAAADCSDTVLILDEMGQADAREVGDAVYMLMNNAGKQRAGRAGAARAVATWRLSVLSTGEVTLADRLAEAGRRMTAGLAVRLLDVPADAGAGMGVFQRLHGAGDPGAMADGLREAARAVHGTAGPVYLESLAADRAADLEGLRRWLNEIIDAFGARYMPAGADGQTRTAVRRFARMAAAGELATDYGVLDWPQGEAARGVGECCAAWLARRGGGGPREDQLALEQVVAFIEAHGASRFEPIAADGTALEGRQRVVNRAGWRVRAGDTIEYWVAAQAWKAEVCRGLDPSRAAEVMHRAGKLVEWTQRHPATRRTVPGEGRVRVYVLRGVLETDDE